MDINPISLDKNLRIIDATGNPVLYQEIKKSGFKQSITTLAYSALNNAVNAFGTDVIIIDNASDTFDSNENERARVREFIRKLVQLRKDRKAAILLLAHIDKQAAKGLGNTESYSGSTAWHNSARSRWYLANTDGRLTLEHHKSNYGKLSDPIYLAWSLDSVLVHIPRANEQDTLSEILLLIRKCFERGTFISPARSSPYNAFKLLRIDPAFPPSIRTREELETILSKGISTGRLLIKTITAGRGKERQIYALAPTAPTTLEQVGSSYLAPQPNHIPCSVPTTTGGVGGSARKKEREKLRDYLQPPARPEERNQASS
jgi:hypothetical protein